MRFRLLFASAFATLISAAGPENDHDKIQGIWVCTRTYVGGHWAWTTGEGGVQVGIRFEGDEYSEFNGKTTSPRGVYKLDPSKRLKQMDLTSDSVFPARIGGSRGKTTVPCIYQLDGDKLKICMGGEGRPGGFAVARDQPDTLMIYKRVNVAR